MIASPEAPAARRWSPRVAGITLALAWLASLASGLAGFYLRYHTLPPWQEMLVAVLVMVPFGMPMGLGNTLGLHPLPNHVLPLTVVFWLALGYGHHVALRRRAPLAVLAVSAVLLAAGWHWLVNAIGLLGL